MIYTGPTALYMRGIIDFNPSRLFISLRHGKDSSKGWEARLGVDEVKIDFETTTYDLFAEDFKGKRVYSIERLLIEINKWDLSSEMKEKAINKMLQDSKPHLLMKAYKNVFKKRRGYYLDSRVEKLINEYKNPIKEIVNGDSRKKINEYFLKQIEDLDLPIVIKGGTAIQAYWTKNRTTLDIDSHSLESKVEEIISKVTNSKNAIRFKAHILKHKKGADVIGPEFTPSAIKGKKVVKLIMLPVIYGSSDKLKELNVKFTINTSISDIEDVIDEFKITKRKIGEFNANILVFTKEMLIAEKYHSLVTKPTNTKRAKDLLDILFLCKEGYNISIVVKWLKKKFISSRTTLEWEQALLLIKDNMDIRFPKIYEQWEKAISMYTVSTSFDEAFNKYSDLSRTIINFGKV